MRGLRKGFPPLAIISSCAFLVFYWNGDVYLNHIHTSAIKAEEKRLKTFENNAAEKSMRNSESKIENGCERTGQQDSINHDGLMDLNINESLRNKIGLLRDALVRAHAHELPLAKHPTCTGDRIKGEVEDLLCMPKPIYLTNVKNPCWWDQSRKLRCLPYFHILGIDKSGSSDLWERVTSHPHVMRIHAVQNKEAMWWSKSRYGVYHYTKDPIRNFSEYTDVFQTLTSKVSRSLRKGGSDHKYFITGDGTPSDLTEFRGWPNITQNRGRKLPHVLTPHLMKHIYPNITKFIVIMRNPIDRLYSDYFYVCRGTSARGFHLSVLKSIDILSNCILNRGLRECFFDDQIYHSLPVRLHLIDYAVYIREWLKVLPRDRFLFLKTEDYQQDIGETVQTCWDFLGLEHLDDGRVKPIASKSHKLVGKKKGREGPMWLSTRKILEEIVRPSTHFLPELVGDTRFTWKFETIPVVDA